MRGVCKSRCLRARGAATREPVWPSGKGVRLVSKMDLGSNPASVLLSLQKGCGLWTLSCDFVAQNYWNIKLALIAAHLNARVMLVVTV